MGINIAIDYGTKYVGFAASDETKLVAATLPHLVIGKDKKVEEMVWKYLKKLNLEIDHIVIGLPTGFDNKPTQMSQEIEEFAQKLSELSNISFSFWNETYTSQQAQATHKLAKDKDRLHSEAARIMLQAYLDFKRTGI